MALDALAACQPGAIPGTVVHGILALKPDTYDGGGYTPLRYDQGPACLRCWTVGGEIRPVRMCVHHPDGAR